ncbi:methyltransferase, UbiE/COQ5 family protein [Aurantiacibacter atlanticus]|uniref:Methyltransferase, UbiE/COQ5 family protein n=1 Tax=Aurantiacibacter atlanticus TaxID=1648404 RepID=A0A0H4VXR0_9SPHN|nr:class I SAM-dependent methyltransferase [Aurantiacibacter atlanticus]AKQ41913.1 methyltransferase, UbiE/COQ5 family protein [Aurantiacibacter atlanticus]MDF1833982.1 class I SAM-dependent methyltransferase [Alteraurantiacibacter sp. bin_em_oilr2.035]
MEQGEWQGRTGAAWAAEWRRTDRSFNVLTEQLLARTRNFSFKTALDIGCGAGELSLAIARGRPNITITGVDISQQLIDVARQRGDRMTNLSFEVADASDWSCDSASAPDLLISRHGVMFFDYPRTTFENLVNQSADGAGLLFSCFGDRSSNPMFTEVARLLPEPPAPSAPNKPGLFAFADPGHVETILGGSGWTHIAAEPFDFPMIAGSGEDPVEDAVAYFSCIGPAANMASELDSDAFDRFQDRVRNLAASRLYDGIVAFPASAWIVTARKG